MAEDSEFEKWSAPVETGFFDRAGNPITRTKLTVTRPIDRDGLLLNPDLSAEDLAPVCANMDLPTLKRFEEFRRNQKARLGL